MEGIKNSMDNICDPDLYEMLKPCLNRIQIKKGVIFMKPFTVLEWRTGESNP